MDAEHAHSVDSSISGILRDSLDATGSEFGDDGHLSPEPEIDLSER